MVVTFLLSFFLCRCLYDLCIGIGKLESVTEELRYDFMMRVPFDPNGHQVFDLLNEMRKEQLCLNPMSDESFLDMYLLNPIQALRQYFKHSIVPAHEERIQQWNSVSHRSYNNCLILRKT